MRYLELSNRLQIIAHFILFYIIWAFTEISLFPFLNMQGDVWGAVCDPIWKIIVWLIPVIVILQRQEYPVFHYLKLDIGKSDPIRWSVLGVVFIVGYHFLMHIIFYAHTDFVPGLTLSQWINTVLIAGIVEEILFRGYFLQKLSELFSFWKANLCVSLLFVSIHIPIWYVNGDKIAQGMVAWLQLITFILGFSLLQGFLLRKSGSLWPCIMMHMMNNFMALALI